MTATLPTPQTNEGLTITTTNGVMATLTVTQLKAAAAANTVYTFSASFTHTVNGHNLSFHKGSSYILEPAVKTALLAVSAPMTAA